MTEPPAKRQKLDMSKTFIAVVGQKKKKFTLHTDVASRSSKFFHAAINNNWKESEQNRVTLVEVEASEFEQYLQWLSTHDHSFLNDTTFRQLAKLYILGDFLDDSAFLVDMFKRFTNRAVEGKLWPCLGTVAMIWDQTPETSPLRKITVEIWITASIQVLASRFAEPAANEHASKSFIVDCLRRVGETEPRANVSLKGNSRRRAIESRRDELLIELVA